jgi:hypothetical protein
MSVALCCCRCCCLQEVSLHYPGTAPEHVLSCVPNEGIFVTMAALLAPGDVVVAMHPGTGLLTCICNVRCAHESALEVMYVYYICLTTSISVAI